MSTQMSTIPGLPVGTKIASLNVQPKAGKRYWDSVRGSVSTAPCDLLYMYPILVPDNPYGRFLDEVEIPEGFEWTEQFRNATPFDDWLNPENLCAICGFGTSEPVMILRRKPAPATGGEALDTIPPEALAVDEHGECPNCANPPHHGTCKRKLEPASPQVPTLREALERGISRETREIERRFNLMERQQAVTTLIHAVEYLRDAPLIPSVVQARSIFYDGIQNVIDGRSTGREWRNVRHRYNNERDGPHPPIVSDADRSCQWCGAVGNPPLTRCHEHRPASLALAAPDPRDALLELIKEAEIHITRMHAWLLMEETTNLLERLRGAKGRA